MRSGELRQRHGAASILPPGITSIGQAIDALLGDREVDSAHDVAVVLGFAEAARRDPATAEVMAAAWDGARHQISALLLTERPGADIEACNDVATAILAIAVQEGLRRGFPPVDGGCSRSAMLRLITRL